MDRIHHLALVGGPIAAPHTRYFFLYPRAGTASVVGFIVSNTKRRSGM